mmetsp:Transcript_31414/g.36124  ORF Transcript_31414/g.36124 Transcript_31414/m.36124 type:complete len:112 (+) Transcript_31414:53-388(+)
MKNGFTFSTLLITLSLAISMVQGYEFKASDDRKLGGGGGYDYLDLYNRCCVPTVSSDEGVSYPECDCPVRLDTGTRSWINWFARDFKAKWDYKCETRLCEKAGVDECVDLI